MPTIQYPNVPNAPGVPNVPRNPTAAPAPAPALNKVRLPNSSVNEAWKIVDSTGKVILKPDTYADFQVRAENIIPNYPIENGGFSSYNQVEKPYNIKMTAIITGIGDLSRGKFFQTVVDLKRSLDVVTIVTPDAIFDNAKLISYNWSQRADHGLTMLQIELVFQEIRQTASAKITVAKPAGNDKKKIGQVSPVPPTAKQSALSKQVKP